MPAKFLLDLPATLPDKDGCIFKRPPLDGSLTIPEIFNWHFVNNPSHSVFIYESAEGITRLPFSAVVPAIHRAARYVASIAMPSSEKSADMNKSPIAILATTDTPSYFCVLVGLMLAGIPAFPISPRNSPASIAHLLYKTEVRHILVNNDTNLQELARKSFAILEHDGHKPPVLESMATFRDLFTDGDNTSLEDIYLTHQTYNYESPVVYVHSSGSSSLPKPIPWNHTSLLQVTLTPYLGAFDLRGEVFGAHPVPMFHASGLNFIPWVAAAGFVMAVFSPISTIPTLPTPENVLSGLIKCKPSFLICVPTFLESWANDAAAVEVLKSLKGVAYGGGPLPSEIGDQLTSQGVKVMTVFGSTEGGVIGALFAEYLGNDWQYFSINPHCAAKFDLRDEGMYELVIVKQPTQVLPIINTKFEGVEAYSTKDLFSPHPTKPGLWKAFGRTDDQIVLSTGSKIHPGPLEAFISKHVLVEAALMFGTGRFQAGVIIFPSSHSRGTEELDGRRHYVAEIWNHINQLNANNPTYSRIFKETILISSREKPLSLTNKGTIRRAATLQLYEEEISELYRNLESGVSQTENFIPSNWTLENTLTFVRAVVRDTMPNALSDDLNLFSNGCDSLQANWIRMIIIDALRKISGAEYSVPLSLVYRFPSITALSNFILDTTDSTRHRDMPHVRSGREELLELLARFEYPLSQQRETRPVQGVSPISTQNEDSVLVTGTTGSLGSHILALLLALPHINRVYALNRRSSTDNILSRQRAALLNQGLSAEIAESSKIVYIEGNLEAGNLGIDRVLEDAILASVTHIVHLAWPINFNLGLSSFDGALNGLRALIDLALNSKRVTLPRFIFASSIGTYGRSEPQYPNILREVPLGDPDLVSNTGYCQSKWIAERMLVTASQNTRLRPIIARIGQLTGSSSGGIWNLSEWFPAMIKTSVGFEFLPQVPGVASWLPVDIAAKAMVDIMDVPQIILHIVHPRPVPYSKIFEHFSIVLNLPLRPYKEWFKELQTAQYSTEYSSGPNRTANSDMLKKLPALKLFEFFEQYDNLQNATKCEEGFSTFDVMIDEGIKYSASLRDARCVDQSDVLSWVAGWRTAHFIV